MRGLKNAKGLVVRKLQHGPPQLLEEASELKGSLTHLVFVCDDAELQRKLPQVIVGNERLLRIRDLATVEAEVPDNVYIVRQKSSWLNEQLFIRVLRWLARALASVRPSRDVVFWCWIARLYI